MARNTNSSLGPGEAADRILRIRAELDAELERAELEVLKRFRGREDAILLRVPADLRQYARRMLVAATDPIMTAPPSDFVGEGVVAQLENPGPELPSPRVVTPHDFTAEEAIAAAKVAQAIDLGDAPTELPGWLKAEVPPLPPGSITTVVDKPKKGRGA